jgi:hypothetical protein
MWQHQQRAASPENIKPEIRNDGVGGSNPSCGTNPLSLERNAAGTAESPDRRLTALARIPNLEE